MALDSTQHDYFINSIRECGMNGLADMDTVLTMVESLRNDLLARESDFERAQALSQSCIDIRIGLLGVAQYFNLIRFYVQGAVENPVVETD